MGCRHREEKEEKNEKRGRVAVKTTAKFLARHVDALYHPSVLLFCETRNATLPSRLDSEKDVGD